MDTAGNLTEVKVETVIPGDVLLVRPGEVLPVDGVLLDGEADFDESSLTGESMPVHKLAGEQLLSGSVNGTRAISMRAAASAADSQYSRIVELVQEASKSRAPMVRLGGRSRSVAGRALPAGC